MGAVENLTERFGQFFFLEAYPNGGVVPSGSGNMDLRKLEGKFHYVNDTLKTYTHFFGRLLDTILYYIPGVTSKWEQSVTIIEGKLAYFKGASNTLLSDLGDGKVSAFATLMFASMIKYAKRGEAPYAPNPSDSQLLLEGFNNGVRTGIDELTASSTTPSTLRKGYDLFFKDALEKVSRGN